MSSFEVVLASGNAGKIREFQALFATTPFKLTSQAQYHVTSAEETGTTFIENAILKAKHAAKITGKPAISDDSGLEIDALQGKPGVYSARYLGAAASESDRCEGILRELKDIPEPQRTARFQCVLVYMRHHADPSPVVVQASWEGKIATSMQGASGHGYDPIFFLENMNCTAAELSSDQKNTLSHRAQAMEKLMQALTKYKIAEPS
jgi:XTP/dITP diphosphohydrolase